MAVILAPRTNETQWTKAGGRRLRYMVAGWTLTLAGTGLDGAHEISGGLVGCHATRGAAYRHYDGKPGGPPKSEKAFTAQPADGAEDLTGGKGCEVL